MADAMHYVGPPCRQPRKGGIFSVAQLIDGQNRLANSKRLEYEPAPCTMAVGNAETCWNGVDNATTAKTYGGIGSATSPIDNFAGYVGIECFLQADEEEFSRRAREHLELVEDRFVEQKFATWLLTLTPTSIAGAASALGAAEADADANYPGQPIIWVSRDLVVRFSAANVLVTDPGSGLSYTYNGTPVVGIAGIPSNVMFITGCVTVYRGDIVTSRSTNHTLNKEMAIAERAYGFTVDCGYAKRFFVGPEPLLRTEPAPSTSTPLTLTVGTIPASPISVGTDVTLHVHTNRTPSTEVTAEVKVNSGSWTDLGELTQVTTDTFVLNLPTDTYTVGDVLHVRAKAESVTSSVIDIDIQEQP